MNITRTMAMTLLIASVSIPALAESGNPPDAGATAPSSAMPMANGKMHMMGGGMDNMPMMKMMEQRHAMMQAHMTKMEAHMANIEKLLQQLVELQKK